MICCQNFVRLLITPRFWLAVLIIFSIGIGLAAIDLGDFDIFYAAALAFRNGINPYTLPSFYSPLYVAFAFVPFTWLPLPVAFHLYAGLVIFSYGIAFYLLTQRRIGLTLLLMFSPFPLLTVYSGNIESWVLLGAGLSPALGIWLVLAKPQMGAIVALLFLIQRWDRDHEIGDVAKLAVPVGAALAISLIAGMWDKTPIDREWNMSLWPWGLLIGVPAAIVALMYRELNLSLLAAPFISPYLGGPASFAGILPALGRRWWLAVAGVVASWGIMFIWRSGILQ